jgi:tripartite-type tricarboxylate transporter receptor subunit TctC
MTEDHMLPRIVLGLLSLWTVGSSDLHAQSNSYPVRSISIIVPTGAGSAPDLLARKLGQKLTATLGQSFVIDNRPGAAGMLGASTVARSVPDGYTLLMAWDGMMVINPLLYQHMNYDPQKDFVPISALGRVEFVLVAHPTFAPNSLPEFISAAKTSPGKIDYASAGIGEVHHIAMEVLAERAGIRLSHVPYKGGPAALNDILGGHVPIGFIGLTPALPLLKNGQLKALATLGRQRSSHLPDVPTVAETLPGYEIEGSWLGLFAPAGTPGDIVHRLNVETNKLIKQSEFSDFLISQGIIPMEISTSQFAQLMQDDTVRFRKIVSELGIRIE